MTDLPTGWDKKKMGAIGRYLNGKAFKSQDWRTSGRPIIRIQNLTGSGDEYNYFQGEIEERYVVKPGDLLFSWSATLGTHIWQGPEAVLNQHIFKVESLIDKRFHRYLLDFKILEMLSKTHGSGMVHITKKSFDEIEVNIPPLPEQQKIVELLEDHLSRLDAALADIKQAKLKAAQFRRSLLQAAFTGNLTGDGTRLMTGDRSNWKEITLGELGKWITGSTPKSSNPLNFGNDVDFVTPSDIGYGGLLGPSERKISHLGASSVRKVKAPSVILVCIGTIGKVALARRDVTTNQQINSLEVDKSVVDPNFVMWLLSSPEIQEKLWKSASSTTVAILNKGNLEKIKTHIPSLPEQRKIVEILEDHLSRLDASVAIADAMEKQSASLRRSLLQAAFTGELTKEVASV